MSGYGCNRLHACQSFTKAEAQRFLLDSCWFFAQLQPRPTLREHNCRHMQPRRVTNYERFLPSRKKPCRLEGVCMMFVSADMSGVDSGEILGRR